MNVSDDTMTATADVSQANFYGTRWTRLIIYQHYNAMLRSHLIELKGNGLKTSK